MKIKSGRVVKVEYVLRGEGDKVLQDTTQEPLHYLHGHKNVVPGLEKVLEGLESGAKFEVTVTPAEGYGEHNDNLLINIPFGELPENVRPMKGVVLNMRFGNHSRNARITKVRLKDVQVDANHPFVGQTLHFKGRVRQVRKASQTEVAHGHVHVGNQDH